MASLVMEKGGAFDGAAQAIVGGKDQGGQRGLAVWSRRLTGIPAVKRFGSALSSALG